MCSTSARYRASGFPSLFSISSRSAASGIAPKLSLVPLLTKPPNPPSPFYTSLPRGWVNSDYHAGSMVHKASRVAAIYDVHGNLPALEAVLADLESVHPDLIVVGGDVVAGPMPPEGLGRLAALREGVCLVRGNADREGVAALHKGLDVH